MNLSSYLFVCYMDINIMTIVEGNVICGLVVGTVSLVMLMMLDGRNHGTFPEGSGAALQTLVPTCGLGWR